jgi:hypothetical protein
MLLISAGLFGALDPKSWLDETYSALLKKIIFVNDSAITALS